MNGWNRIRTGVIVLLAIVAALSATARADAPPPKVAVIGDSVLTGVFWYSQPSQVLEQNLDIRWHVAVCRRLTGVSCTFQGVTPPNLLQVVGHLGTNVGPTAVVMMGYNDNEQRFASSVEQAIQALLHAGVTRIIWPTLREARHPYIPMNAVLEAAAKRHPELSVPDWNVYSRSHPDWFQDDGIHLEPAGGMALATFLHQAIVQTLAKPLPIEVRPTDLVAARVGHPYSVQLHAEFGAPPYRFRVVSGALPRGLMLAANGLLHGTAMHAGGGALVLHVTDAHGRVSTVGERLVAAAA